MNKSGSEAQATHRKVQASTTLSRKYVKAPTAKLSAEKIASDYRAERQLRRQAIADQMNREAAERAAKKRQQKTIVIDRIVTTPATPEKPKTEAKVESPAKTPAKTKIPISTPAKTTTPIVSPTATTTPVLTPTELKNQAITKALKNAATVEEPKKPKFGLGRIMLALSCAAVSVFAIVYFVNLNMPNFSLRVAAMQTGIEATYPNYIPYEFSLKGITSEDKKITINFSNSEGKSFVLTEEKSSWDSSALLNNYVKGNYQDYATIREQGLTIFMAPNKATWVSGGIIYEVISDADSLSQKQMKSIAVSL